MNKRTAQLRQLMAQNNLSCRDVAEITGRTENTVRIWRCKHGARVIPEHTLRLLEAELKLATKVTA